jgi:hypothetical protein
MRKYQNSLLVGVAALALVTGTGFVAAQTMNHSGTSAGGAGPATELPSGTHSMNGSSQGAHGTGAGMKSQGRGGAGMSAQNPAGNRNGMSAQSHGQSGAQDRNAQNGRTGNRANQSANENRRNERQNTAQERGQRGNEQQNTLQGQRSRPGNEQRNTLQGRRGQPGNEQRNALQGQRGQPGNEQRNTLQGRRGQPGNEQQNTLQGQRGMRGLQGNAAGQMQGSRRVETSSGRSVELSQDQRTRIRQTIIESGNAPRAGHVNFDVRTGTVIPRSEFTGIHVVRVPQYLVQIEPRWRGYDYFVYQDRIVIVEPRDLRIVAVVPA